MRANHKDTKVLLGNELIEVKRGQFITSIRKLCDEWNWSNTKVKNFLKLLEQDEMITHKSDTKKTVITIVNYGVYHDREEIETTPKRHEGDTKATREHTDKNDKECSKNDKEEIVEIINYLNDVADKNFRPTTQKTKRLINARMNEGFTIDDFKRVIDIKTKEWKHNKDMSQYLRPETLFGTKFESYLNQDVVKNNGIDWDDI